MAIVIDLGKEYRSELDTLKNNISHLNEVDETSTITKRNLNQIYNILNNNELKLLCRNILKNKYLDSFTYQDLVSMHTIIDSLNHNLTTIKDMIDIDMFFEKGNLINIKKLKLKFRQLGREKIFPKFNFKRLKELFENPPKKLKPQDMSGEHDIIYDPFIVRKYMYGIIQMVVNEMDLLVGYTGSEGSGKSCGCSQDINLMYYLLKELGLITYKYDINEMFFSTLDNFLTAEDNHFDEKFRILGLDEGNELNRQDWQDERVKTFFQRLRRERYNQRIKFICLPQLGELMTAIVLSRMNFIFNMYSTDDIETGTLNKGYCKFYIIPRNDKIYSPHQKLEITKKEIIDNLVINLDDKKKYLKEIPSKLLIKKFRKNYIWGFSKKDYDKNLKETNKTFSVNKGIRLTEYQAYCYYKSRPPIKDWAIDKKEEKDIYATLIKLDRAICKQFDENPEKTLKYEKLLENKRSRKK